MPLPFSNASVYNYPLRMPEALLQHFDSEFRPPKTKGHYFRGQYRQPRWRSDVNRRARQDLNQRRRQQPQATLRPGVYSCGHQGSEMFINFVNPQFPAHDTSTGTCVFKVDLRSDDICQVI